MSRKPWPTDEDEFDPTDYYQHLAAAALDRLREVRRYLAHDAECDRFDDMTVPCTCGLDALLADLLPK